MRLSGRNRKFLSQRRDAMNTGKIDTVLNMIQVALFAGIFIAVCVLAISYIKINSEQSYITALEVQLERYDKVMAETSKEVEKAIASRDKTIKVLIDEVAKQELHIVELEATLKDKGITNKVVSWFKEKNPL